MSCKPPTTARTAETGRVCLQLTAAAVLVASLAALGCVRAGERTSSSNVPLRVGFALSTGGANSAVQQLVSNLTGERLLTIGDDGRPTPRLVERWSVSGDHLTWTLTLRPGLKFHDGSPATAEAVRDLLQPELDRPDRQPGFMDVTSITVTDERTLVVTLRRPSFFLLEELAGHSLIRQTPGGAVSLGAYFLESSTPESTVLRSFGDYFQGRPSIDRLDVRAFRTVRTAWAAMMRDEIDMVYEVGRDAIEFVESESSVQVYSFSRPYVYVLGFNLRRPLLARKDLRRALGQAIDRNVIVRGTLRGRGRPAESFVWPLHWAYDRTAPVYGYDADAARRLLDQAGFPVKIEDGRERRLRLTCLIPERSPFFESMALVVQKQLDDVGVDLVVEQVSTSDLVRRFQTGEFDTFLFELASPRLLSWPYRFLHSPLPGQAALVNSGYAAADAALDRIRRATTDDQVRAAVAELQRVLYDDPPAVFISWDERARAVSRRFAVPAQPGRDVWPSLWRWRPAGAATATN